MTRSVFNHRRGSNTVVWTLRTQDSFNRARNASALGTTDGSGSLDPIAWNAETGVCGIIVNQADAESLTSGLAIADIDFGTANVDISITLAHIAAGNCGIAFRLVDTSNYWLLYGTNSGTKVALRHVHSGSTTNDGTVTSSAADGDVIRVVAYGNNIDCYWNGTLSLSASNSFNNTATKHGVYFDQVGTPRLDSWVAYGA